MGGISTFSICLTDCALVRFLLTFCFFGLMLYSGPLYGNRESRYGRPINQQGTGGSTLTPLNQASRKQKQLRNAANGGADSSESHQIPKMNVNGAANGHTRAPAHNVAEGKQQQHDQPATVRADNKRKNSKHRHRQQNHLHGSEPIIGHSSHHEGHSRCLVFQKGNNNSFASSSSGSDDSTQPSKPLRRPYKQPSSALQSGLRVGQQEKLITTWLPGETAVDVFSVTSAPARTLNCPSGINRDAPTSDPASSPAVLYYVYNQRQSSHPDQCSRLLSASTSGTLVHEKGFKMVTETKI